MRPVQIFRQRLPDGSVRTWPPGEYERCVTSQNRVQHMLDQLEQENAMRQNEAVQQRLRQLVREEQREVERQAGFSVR